MEARDQLKKKRDEWMKQKKLDEQFSNMGVDLNQKNKDLVDLTYKIADKMNVQIQSQNQQYQQQQETQNKIVQEIEQNTCSICYELMIPPLNSPILLFPCGHTFCKTCVYKTDSIRQKQVLNISKCPLCRNKVESAALNISLQNLILSYKQNQQKPAVQNVQSQRSNPNNNFSSDADSSSYEQEYKMCKMRIQILQEEYHEIKKDNEKLFGQQSSNKEVINHLRQRQQSIKEQISKLQTESDLINDHLLKNEEENDYVQGSINSNNEKIKMIKQSIELIQEQKQKFKIMSQLQQ